MTMFTILSEYPLYPDDELHNFSEFLHVYDVGVLAQYHSYLDMFWEKCIPHFVRDCYLEMEQDNMTMLYVKTLNSKILENEMQSLSDMSKTLPQPPPIERQKASREPPVLRVDASEDVPTGGHPPEVVSEPVSDPVPLPPPKPASRKRKAPLPSDPSP